MRIVSTYALASVALTFACAKKKDSTTTVADSPIVATDVSTTNVIGEFKEIIPSGSLTMSLSDTNLTTTYGSPCADSSNGTYPTGAPKPGTVQCAVASLFSDPDVFTNVGGYGFFESLKMMSYGIVPLAKSCVTPLTGTARTITISALETTGEFACGKDPTGQEFWDALTANMSSSGSGGFLDGTPDLSALTVKVTWGENASLKNLLMGLGDDSSKDESSVWWYQKNKSTNIISLKSSQFHNSSGTGYSSRKIFQGNPTTHEFLGNYRDADSSGHYYAIRTMGVKAAGSYYYMEIISNQLTDKADGTGAVIGDTTPKAFCFNSGDNTAADLSNCASYATTLASTAFFTSSQLPSSRAQISFR